MAVKQKKAASKVAGKKRDWRTGLFVTLGLIAAIVMLPTTVLLMVGMLPTLVAALFGKYGRGSIALTVGAMNLAGCSPFLFHLGLHGHSMQLAFELILDPLNIVVIYGAAALGYLINWSLSGIVSTVIVQRSYARLEDIKKHQEALVKRWGEEVTGELPLDEDGFPLSTKKESVESDDEEEQE
ncbi:MAG: hypothetical protein H6868_09930 [Rhodospirillales bacterium]|nr:hypothetical protein [Rhodospirillales bacterium]